MSHYKSNLRDIEFNLFEVFGGDGEALGVGPFEGVDRDTAREMLREVERLAREQLADVFASSDRTPPASIIDVCTGSGCLAVVLAREFGGAAVIATDISDAAIEVARRQIGRRPDGVWLVDLTAGPDPADDVARTLDVGGRSATAPTESLRGYLADRDLLLIVATPNFFAALRNL